MEDTQNNEESTVLCREIIEAFAPHSIRRPLQVSAWTRK